MARENRFCYDIIASEASILHRGMVGRLCGDQTSTNFTYQKSLSHNIYSTL